MKINRYRKKAQHHITHPKLGCPTRGFQNTSVFKSSSALSPSDSIELCLAKIGSRHQNPMLDWGKMGLKMVMKKQGNVFDWTFIFILYKANNYRTYLAGWQVRSLKRKGTFQPSWHPTKSVWVWRETVLKMCIQWEKQFRNHLEKNKDREMSDLSLLRLVLLSRSIGRFGHSRPQLC